MKFTIRAAVQEDCSEIMRMIRELAEYEQMADQVRVTEEVLKKDGFSDDPSYGCFVAELDPGQKSKEGFSVVAYALYFFTYSTWTGRCLYLEDLYVMPDFRGNGIGKKLISKVAEMCQELGCCRLDLSALDWNKPAMNLYTKNGAMDLTNSTGRHLLRFQGKALEDLALSKARN